MTFQSIKISKFSGKQASSPPPTPHSGSSLQRLPGDDQSVIKKKPRFYILKRQNRTSVLTQYCQKTLDYRLYTLTTLLNEKITKVHFMGTPPKNSGGSAKFPGGLKVIHRTALTTFVRVVTPRGSSTLLPPDVIDFAMSVARFKILAGNSFIVTCHVTPK